MTTLALLAKEVGVNERTLRRAVDEGTLRGRRLSPRRLELSLAERGYVRRSWRLLAALRRALRTEQNARFALLFGSVAAGADTADSDIDVLVDLRDGSLERVADLNTKLSVATGRSVDVVRLKDAEGEPSFLADVLVYGRVLVDRDGLWPRLREREPQLDRCGRQEDGRRTRSALAGIDGLIGA
jgi:predicted nucleotidyltransferase